MTRDTLDSAYATLGVRRGASAVVIKRRYRALVRQWHPDQFANDPQGVTDATLMLKAINRAYRTIIEHRAPEAVHDAPGQPAASHTGSAFGVHLTPQQLDDIIDAIRHSESLLGMVFDDGVAGWRSRAASIAVVSMIAAMAWQSGQTQWVVVCVLPLLCVWFPDVVGSLNRDNITPAPGWIVWLLGWAILLVVALGVSLIWFRSQ